MGTVDYIIRVNDTKTGPYNRGYIAASRQANFYCVRQPRQPQYRLQVVFFRVFVFSCFSLSVAAKHDSRDIKITLKLIFGFLYRGCCVSRLPRRKTKCRQIPMIIRPLRLASVKISFRSIHLKSLTQH